MSFWLAMPTWHGRYERFELTPIYDFSNLITLYSIRITHEFSRGPKLSSDSVPFCSLCMKH